MKHLLKFLFLFISVMPLFGQTTVRVATGLAQPLFVTYAPGDYDRIFIVEQHEARIRVLHLDSGVLDPNSYLDIDSLVISSGNERGLLGLAFHPDYQTNRYFYVSYNDNSGTSVIARFTASSDPDSAIATSRFTIMTQTQPYENHNGGCINFGPDGYLYFGLGDGGSGQDPQNYGQSTNTLLGKMLRIDVNNIEPPLNYAIPEDNPFVGVAGYREEIWSLGLRNPWRWSFDRLTGDLYIADVGQDTWEEVNVAASADTGGNNYGWRCLEAFECTSWGGPACDCEDAAFVFPVTAYNHGIGCSITGGYVYRGCAIPEFYGTYFYADYCSARIWSFHWDGNDGTTDSTEWTAAFVPPVGSIGGISSFGEDAFGELYICDLSGGEVFKVVPDLLVDCNGNAVSDECDIAAGFSQDIDGDAIPDECDDCLPIAVADLSIFITEDELNFRWHNIGGDSASYTLWQSSESYAPFPAGWTEVAADIAADPDGFVYHTISPLAELSDAGFFRVATVCE